VISVTNLFATAPGADEYAPYYAGYVARVPAGDVLDALEKQIDETLSLFTEFGEARGGHRYAPEKWSVRQMAGHLADTERVFVYRAMCIARGETQSLPGFDENAYVAGANFEQRSLASLMGELAAVRRATLTFFRNLDEAALLRRGTANASPVTPRAIAYILAGHERHHLAILRERYA
jgi:hypothetical protein